MNNKNNLNQQPPTEGYIDVLNYGGFFVRFWGNYTLNGIEQEFYVGAFAVGGERKTIIPKEAMDITVHIEIEVFPFVWNEVGLYNYSKSDQLCYIVYGVTAYAVCKEIPCTSPGAIKEVFGQGIFMPMGNENHYNNCTFKDRHKSNSINYKNSSCFSKTRYSPYSIYSEYAKNKGCYNDY